VRVGVLRSPYKGVYISASAPVTLEQRCAALCAAHPNGAVTGPTAGLLAGLRRMPRSAPLNFTLRHGVHLAGEPGVRLRQTTVLRPSDRLDRGDGVVTVSWARLAFDLAADLGPLDHLSVLNQLLHERLVGSKELVAIGVRLCHPGRPGSRCFRRTLESLSPSAPNESHSEVVLANALRNRGVPVEHQTRLVRSPTGRTARVDLAVPSFRWGVELDIHPEHRSLDGRAKDAQRERDLHLLAWQIEPVTEQDLLDVARLADELTLLYRARRLELEIAARASA